MFAEETWIKTILCSLCLLPHQGQWLVMDSLLWPVTLPILPTGSSGGTSLSSTSLKSVMVSRSWACTGGRGISYRGAWTQKATEHWHFHHLVEQLIARYHFCSSPSVIQQTCFEHPPWAATHASCGARSSAKVDTEMKLSLFWGVHQPVAHCPKLQCLSGTEKQRKRMECRNWELVLVPLEERLWWC